MQNYLPNSLTEISRGTLNNMMPIKDFFVEFIEPNTNTNSVEIALIYLKKYL